MGIDDPGTEPVWPAMPIRDMTAEHLAAMIARLRAADPRDKALIEALQTELTFRQVGIRRGREARSTDTDSV